MNNFDILPERHGTNSLKWDFAKERGKNKDILPLWVADMDFRLPDEILNKFKSIFDQGIFGYSEPLDSYYDAIINWNKRHYDLYLDRKYIINGCGVVFSIANLIRALTKENDAILINEPVYYPFKETILANNRRVAIAELKPNKDNKYYFDYDLIEKKIIEDNVKIYLLCNPHNPVGRAWDRSELEKIAEIAKRHNVFVISDEIHEDFVYNKKYVSIGKVMDKGYAICTAPSKTFNIPGLHSAYSYIPDDKILNDYKKELVRVGYSQSNIVGIKALEIVYNYGDKWLKDVKEYIYNNYLFMKEYLRINLPLAKVTELEATYLVWVDFSAYNLSDRRLKEIIEDKALVWLDGGIIFGRSGSGFERFNIATTKALLKEALDRIIRALNEV